MIFILIEIYFFIGQHTLTNRIVNKKREKPLK